MESSPRSPMRLVLFGSLLILSLGSALLHWTLPEQQKDHPVLYWSTTNDITKFETVDLFYKWRRDRGLPPVEVVVDFVNQHQTKRLIQGVSGVGGDLIDVYAPDFSLFRATGMLKDVTEEAEIRGFSADRTYTSSTDFFVWEGRQYGFPRNVAVNLIWANRDTFERHGIPVPPRRWSWDEFEELGQRFVEAANVTGTRDRTFFLNDLQPITLQRGLGVCVFNETLTASTLDDPRVVEVFERMRRWTVEMRLMPTRQEAETYAADAGGYAHMFSFFGSGRYAMINVARWATIQLRPRGRFQMAVSEPPSSGFRNAYVGAGIVAVYERTRYPEEALDFLEFLTSEPFNLLIARSGDSLPPIPAYAQHKEFTNPSGFENEWGLHERFSRAATEIGIPQSASPYVLPSIVFRIERSTQDALYAGRLSPEEAARSAARLINAEIAVTLSRDPALAEAYAADMERQRQIDARRAAGEPVPLDWITNPFHRAYYRAQGWLTHDN